MSHYSREKHLMLRNEIARSGKWGEARSPFCIHRVRWGLDDQTVNQKGFRRFPLPKALMHRVSDYSSMQQVSTQHVLLALFLTWIGRYFENRSFTVGLLASHSGTLGALTVQLREEMRLFQIAQELEKAQEGPFSSYSPEGSNRNGTDVPLPFGVATDERSWENRRNSSIFRCCLQVDISSLIYDTDQLPHTIIEPWVDQWTAMMEYAVQNPESSWKRLPLLGPQEGRNLLKRWNQTAVSYPRGVTLHHLFEEQVKRTPDRVAVLYEDNRLTYRELNERANRLARRLIRLGVGPDTLVGICMERSLHLMISLLSILKAGGAYVPIDPGLPRERISFLIRDADTDLLLTQERFLPDLSDQSKRLVVVDRETWMKESPENPKVPMTEDHLAYVIYTSGSTGTPKGVQIPHKGIVNRILWMQDAYRLTEQDRVLQKTPFSFDVSVWEFFWPLLTGAVLVFALPGGQQDPGYLVALIRKQRITTLHFVPGMLQVFLEEPDVEQCLSVRQVICSGEALPYSLQERFFSRFHTAALHNLYGPTEASVDVSYWACQRDGEEKVVPIGRPIANMELYILDSYLQPVPVFVTGELMIGGIGLATGYHRRPKLTAERFIPHPFADEPGVHLYRTGDRARFLPDGSIEYLGRDDYQVKIRGFRIELGEVEARLGEHPSIRDAVVVCNDTYGQKRLVAYYVSQVQADPPTGEDLQQVLQQTLPEYMVPSKWIRLQTFPFTPNGKVDRNALPSPEWERDEGATSYHPPKTEAEKQLVKIWTSILRVKRVGVRDDFFSLGGDSILALQILSRARQKGIHFKPKEIFDHPTVEALAKRARTSRKMLREHVKTVTGDVPLTPVQQWFFESSLPEPQYYNFPLLVRVDAAVDVRILEQAVEQVILSHDTFRLRYVKASSGWKQVYTDSAWEGAFQVVDLSSLPRQGQIDALERHTAWMQGRLHLKQGPLARWIYYHMGAGEDGRLFLLLHHLIVDGVSWRILLEDLQTAYCQLLAGAQVQLPNVHTSYGGWSRLLADYACSDTLLAERKIWERTVSQPVWPLPLDFENGPNTERSARTVRLSFSKEETQAILQAVPKIYRTRVNDVLLTALLRAFTKWSGDSTLRLDLEGHGREDLWEDVDLTRTIGWFTSIFPVVLHADSQWNAGAWIKKVKEELRAIPHHGIGYGLLRYLSPVAERLRQLDSSPSEMVFNYLGQFDSLFASGSLFQAAEESVGPWHHPNGLRRHKVEILGQVVNRRLEFQFTYSCHLHREDSIRRFAHEYRDALQEIIEHCQLSSETGYTPSDFTGARLNQKELDTFLRRMKRRERTGGGHSG